MGWLGAQVGSQQPHPGPWRGRERDHREAGGRGSSELVKLREAKFFPECSAASIGFTEFKPCRKQRPPRRSLSRYYSG